MSAADRPLRVVIINKSDATGGAAVVSRRLMEALRGRGIDARMLVVEKLTDSPFIATAASHRRAMLPFLEERLGIFLANGLDRADLFKVDTGAFGLPLWRHPWVRQADVVCLNWVNQGMLSLRGIEKIAAMGKPVVWTMHDLWCATGICHHPGSCSGWLQQCGRCPFLGRCASPRDLSHRVHRNKSRLYARVPIHFVAVSNWLADKCRRSSLLAAQDLSVIPNAFSLPSEASVRRPASADEPVRLLMGAARLDDPVKGFTLLIEATKHLDPAKYCLTLFGSIRDASLLDRIAIPHEHLGTVHGADRIRSLYEQSHIVVSSSLYETLPGTLVEGQAYGAIPVSFDRGGQPDIVAHGETGFLAHIGDDDQLAARELSAAIDAAAQVVRNADDYPAFVERMRSHVSRKFSYEAIADAYIALFGRIAAR